MKSLSEVIGNVAAKYRLYLERENQKAHEEAKQQIARAAYYQAQYYFPLIMETFYRALQNSSERIQAHVPRFKEKCAHVPHIAVSPDDGFTTFNFWFYLRGNMAASDIQRTLNHELAQECYFRGVPKLFARVTIGDGDRALVQIAWEDSLRERMVRRKD